MSESKKLTISEILSDRIDEVKKLEAFNKLLDKQPNPKSIKQLSTGGGKSVDYIPVQIMESMLDMLFLGQWKTTNFQYSCIGNELLGSLEIHYKNPVTGEWITRVGVAGAQIRMKKDSMPDTVAQNKLTNALVMDAPKLRAECFKNACQQIGRIFGRDLRRQDSLELFSLVTNDLEAQNETLLIQIKTANTLDELDTIIDTNRDRLTKEMLAEYETQKQVLDI